METTPITFYFPSDVNLFLGSAKRKADTNLAVIELIKEIDKEGRFATPDEQELISHYVGYGDSSVLSARYSDFVETVTNEEFAALRASTLNAHYTSLPIIRFAGSGQVCFAWVQANSLHSVFWTRQRASVISAASLPNAYTRSRAGLKLNSTT